MDCRGHMLQYSQKILDCFMTHSMVAYLDDSGVDVVKIKFKLTFHNVLLIKHMLLIKQQLLMQLYH